MSEMVRRLILLAVPGWGGVLLPFLIPIHKGVTAVLALLACGLGLALLVPSRTGPVRGSLLVERHRLLGASLLIFAVSFHLLPLSTGLVRMLPEALAFMTFPFLACLILVGIHTYLGVHVIARGVIFVDLCLAQIAALGTLYAFLLGFATGSPAAYGISLGFTFIGAAVFSLGAPRSRRVPLEAVIGIVYAVATAASLLILSRAPHEAEHIRDILTGSILWVDQDTVIKTARIYGLIGIYHVLFYPAFRAVSFGGIGPRGGRALWDVLFYISFGFVITSSVAIAGVLLVFSFLVIPAVISMLFATRLASRLAIGWSVGTVVSVISLVVSYVYDLPSGPCVVTSFGLSLLVLSGLSAAMRIWSTRRTLSAMVTER